MSNNVLPNFGTSIYGTFLSCFVSSVNALALKPFSLYLVLLLKPLFKLSFMFYVTSPLVSVN